MAKLVLLSEGLTGRSHELIAEKTTIGRVEGNTIQIPEPSISSNHCEILLRGKDIVVKDLNSTNGTFIEGNQVTESVLLPGQILRLGQIQMRLETADTAAAKKANVDSTMVMSRGVTLNELEQGPRTTGFDTAGKGFSKKTDKGNKWFTIGVAVFIVIIIAGLAWAFRSVGK